jgi:hypothetical protein
MPNVLRTATPAGDWRSFKFTCDDSDGLLGQRAAWAAGVPWLYQIEDSVGVLIDDADFGEEGVLWYHAEKIIVAKMHESTDIFLPGMGVYWDPTTRLVTPEEDSDFINIGIATEPAGADDLLVEIDLRGAGAALA